MVLKVLAKGRFLRQKLSRGWSRISLFRWSCLSWCHGFVLFFTLRHLSLLYILSSRCLVVHGPRYFVPCVIHHAFILLSMYRSCSVQKQTKLLYFYYTPLVFSLPQEASFLPMCKNHSVRLVFFFHMRSVPHGKCHSFGCSDFFLQLV